MYKRYCMIGLDVEDYFSCKSIKAKYFKMVLLVVFFKRLCVVLVCKTL